MESYVNQGEQLVVALYVRDIKKSSEFYRSYGFEVLRDEGTFMELKWEDARLFLSEVPGTSPPPANLIGNVRIMVPDVDKYWHLANEKEATIKDEFLIINKAVKKYPFLKKYKKKVLAKEHFLYGLYFLDKGNIQDAKRNFLKAIKYDSKNFRVLITFMAPKLYIFIMNLVNKARNRIEK